MDISLTPSMEVNQHLMQIESFWNLISTSDDAVQLGVYSLLANKFAHNKADAVEAAPSQSFRQMKGILESTEDIENLRDEYINSKYDI